tara:strand:+ start:782 stop:1729 length:948 start_codon:yes stop_codon:yes gene_type:complete
MREINRQLIELYEQDGIYRETDSLDIEDFLDRIHAMKVGRTLFGYTSNAPLEELVEIPGMTFTEAETRYLDTYGALLASKLYDKDPNDIEVVNIDVMVNGNTLPVRYRVKIASIDEEREFYVKEMDPIRLFGLEAYSRLVEVGEDYNFLFNGDHIVENALEGRSIVDMEAGELAALTENRRYVFTRIELDVLQYTIGLTDIFVGQDLDPTGRNYLIASDGRIKVIDFDGMTSLKEEQFEVEERKDGTAMELGITRETYDEMYGVIEENVIANFHRNKDHLYKLLDILGDSGGDMFEELYANNVRRRLDQISGAYQ